MLRKGVFLFVVFFALIGNYTVFPQSVAIDTALSNAVKEIAASVPRGTKIAVLNMSSDYGNLSDYIIDELVVNLVNTRQFQVVPRSTVELATARKEFDFQLSMNVSDASKQRLGQFLGAETIVSGSITRDSANSYRLLVSAIDLKSFTYQTSYRTSIQNNNKMKELVAATGGEVFYADYTIGQRIGMGAGNIFLGLGSILNGHHIGWVTFGVELFGLPFFLFGDPLFYDDGYYAGRIFIGAGVVFGLIVPFFHHKPNNTRVSQSDFPFDLELVSSNNQGENGLKVSYKMSF